MRAKRFMRLPSVTTSPALSIRVWVKRLEAGALDEEAQAADLLQGYEAKIAALERLAGKQALEIIF